MRRQPEEDGEQGPGKGDPRNKHRGTGGGPTEEGWAEAPRHPDREVPAEKGFCNLRTHATCLILDFRNPELCNCVCV